MFQIPLFRLLFFSMTEVFQSEKNIDQRELGKIRGLMF